MRSLRRRGPDVPAEVLDRAALTRGDRLLTSTQAQDETWLLATRDALVIVPVTGTVRVLPWERVDAADWSLDDERLRVSEVAAYGQVKPVHLFGLDRADGLLPVLRERVSASVLLQRRVVLSGRRGIRIIARRPPGGQGEVVWACELDAGLDPEDPEVRELADRGLRAAAEELGFT